MRQAMALGFLCPATHLPLVHDRMARALGTKPRLGPDMIPVTVIA